ncbi:peroxiredoxin family protein [bacterium]|nr:peroxiredoxin family protein [bacterium]
MKKIITVLLAIMCCQPALAASEESQRNILKVGKPAVEFTLEDTEETKLGLKQLRGSVVILTVIPETHSQKERKEYFQKNTEWIEAFRQKYGEQIVMLGMIKLSVPFFAKGMARTKIREKQSIRFLLDWHGDVLQVYSHPEELNMVLIDKAGIVRALATGEYSKGTAMTINDELDKLLAKKNEVETSADKAEPEKDQLGEKRGLK